MSRKNIINSSRHFVNPFRTEVGCILPEILIDLTALLSGLRRFMSDRENDWYSVYLSIDKNIRVLRCKFDINSSQNELRN